jgi:hypothetical protein
MPEPSEPPKLEIFESINRIDFINEEASAIPGFAEQLPMPAHPEPPRLVIDEFSIESESHFDP